MTSTPRRRGLAAPLALPAGFAALLAVGALAAATGGWVDATGVLVLAAVIVTAGSFVAEPAVAPLLGAIGWLTVVGFSRAPYAQLHPTGALAARRGDRDRRRYPDRRWYGCADAKNRIVVHTMDCGRARRPLATGRPGKRAAREAAGR